VKGSRGRMAGSSHTRSLDTCLRPASERTAGS
jgi:hypothetical protein